MAKKLLKCVFCKDVVKSELKNSKIHYRPRLSMAVTENSSLLFSSCHLELVISENSQFFACYLDK